MLELHPVFEVGAGMMPVFKRMAALGSKEFEPGSGTWFPGEGEGANIAEESVSLRNGRNSLVELRGRFFAASFFGEKEKGLVLGRIVMTWDKNGAANSAAEIVSAIKRLLRADVKIIAGIKKFIADEFVTVPVKMRLAGLGGHQHGSRSATAKFRAVIRGENLQLADGVQAGVNDQCAGTAVDAGIEDVAAVHVEIVVLDAASVHAVLDAAFHSDQSFILAGLIAYAGRQGDQLREIPTI